MTSQILNDDFVVNVNLFLKNYLILLENEYNASNRLCAENKLIEKIESTIVQLININSIEYAHKLYGVFFNLTIMKHTEKVKMAKRMLTNLEKSSNTPPFLSEAWKKRKLQRLRKEIAKRKV